ncbi:MAG TPA: indolepyruvate oxidoreductase subunit B [Oxalobacteraceae bacterium]|nr:indolepyruvate oxidoreductase subunit B [Oxalobacteraceae bacterium]
MNQEMQGPLLPQRPVTILIAALGGEGGGMFADWLVAAAMDCDYPVQSTSIPGVSQRTGATTYYVEIYPVPAAQLDGRMPVMALTPTAGAIDVVAASELIEAGRALQNAYLDADRTTLVASTHRVYAVAEKVTPGDGRADSEKVLAAVRAGARHAVLFDMAQVARKNGSMINAVLFGALAGSGALPLPRDACEQAIRNAGKGAEASLRGFAAGYQHAEHAGGNEEIATPASQAVRDVVPVARVHLKFPVETHAVLDAGVARLTDYQDTAYATLYLDRMEPILALDREAGGAAGGYKLTRETGRQLALWMTFEDLIRVADLKTRKTRFERVRKEVGAGPDDMVVVTEYLKPGLDEFCSILPPRAAQRLRQWAEKHGKEESLSTALHVKTSSLFGFLLLRGLSCLRPWRRHTSRYHAEQALIGRWLGAIKRLGFAVQDVELALEIAECARLVKGYGDTHRNGVTQFERIFDTIVESGTESDPKKLREAISRARSAALANPDAAPAPQNSMSADPGKKMFWAPRASAGKAAEKTAGEPACGSAPVSR